MNLHEILSIPYPSENELRYILEKSSSVMSSLEELNILVDYCFTDKLWSYFGALLVVNIKENPACDEELLLKIKALIRGDTEGWV
jgi:hypothetical protein